MGRKITETEYRCVRCGKTMLRVDDTIFCEDCDISFQLERYLEIQEILMEAGIINEDGDIVDQEDYATIYSDKPSDDRPPYCQICDGPYPNCTTSCNLFDD